VKVDLNAFFIQRPDLKKYFEGPTVIGGEWDVERYNMQMILQA
jgi:hypothetical protein